MSECLKGRIVLDRIAASEADLKTTTWVDTLTTISLFILFVFSVAFIAIIYTSTAKAQSAALANDPATLATAAEESNNPKRFAYSGQFIVETTRSADEAHPASYTGWYLLSGSATHKATAITGTLRTAYGREYTYQRDDNTNGAFDNPIATVSKSFLNDRDFKSGLVDSVSVSLNGAIGANPESARRKFLWSNGLAVTLGKAMGGFTLRQSFGYTHSFYEYDIRNDGTVNSPDSVKSATSLFYDVTPKFSFGGVFSYGVAKSFQGVNRAGQQTQFTMDYSITNKIVASLGVASDRSTIEPDGQSDHIRFYAPEAAQYFVDLLILL